MTPVTQWSRKAHAWTWIPLASLVVAALGSGPLMRGAAAANPFVLKASFVETQQKVDTLLIFRLQDEVDALTLKRDRLQRMIDRSDDDEAIREWRMDLNGVQRKLGVFADQLEEACDTPQLRLFC